MRIYAIGDIHGQLDMLRHAHELIEADRNLTGDKGAPVVHLGDYTDRGPNSAGVLQALIDGIAAGHPWLVIKGNHDRLFAEFLEQHDWEDPYLAGRLHWFDPRLGGDKTLASYGVEGVTYRPIAEVHREAVDAVPMTHRAFLKDLPLWHQTAELLFVHAGIRPGIPLEKQDEEDLIWIRDGFLEDDRDHGKLVVHGHTALTEPGHFGNRVNLDSGAGYFRPLSVAVFRGTGLLGFETYRARGAFVSELTSAFLRNRDEFGSILMDCGQHVGEYHCNSWQDIAQHVPNRRDPCEAQKSGAVDNFSILTTVLVQKLYLNLTTPGGRTA